MEFQSAPLPGQVSIETIYHTPKRPTTTDNGFTKAFPPQESKKIRYSWSEKILKDPLDILFGQSFPGTMKKQEEINWKNQWPINLLLLGRYRRRWFTTPAGNHEGGYHLTHFTMRAKMGVTTGNRHINCIPAFWWFFLVLFGRDLIILPHQGQILLLIPVGHQTVISNPHKSIRYYMEHKSMDKLIHL